MKKPDIQKLEDLDVRLYYGKGVSRKTFWSWIEKAAKGYLSEVPAQHQWLLNKLKLNYNTWKALPWKARVFEIRKNIKSLIQEFKNRST